MVSHKRWFSPIFAGIWLLCMMSAAVAQEAEPVEEPRETSLAEKWGVAGMLDSTRPIFGEDVVDPADEEDDGWRFGFHGSARMPLRASLSSASLRGPYLVDDSYFFSGFAYLPIHETEWAELFLSAQKENTRFVLGLHASQFSDWSEIQQAAQAGIATAFVESHWMPTDWLGLGLRAGMFWERHGWIAPYDTYVFGRSHLAGVRLATRWWDLVRLEMGFGAHAEVITNNQGFTPSVWGKVGVDFEWAEANAFAMWTWTEDAERQFSIIEEGDIRVMGGDVRLAVPYVGSLSAAVSHVSANQASWTANAWELLHSLGGRGLTQNYFGMNSEDGTGEILTTAVDLHWDFSRTLAPWSADNDALRALSGFNARLFAMTSWVFSEQQSDNPTENFHDRLYVKWGAEALYRPPWEGWSQLFVAFRFDRVILDTDHESLAFRVITPRIGVSPLKEVDVFLSYSRYEYGENIKLRPNQISGDPAATEPDTEVMKIQAQIRW
jgi:hypothetical protein